MAVPGVPAQTKFNVGDPLGCFTTVADRMIRNSTVNWLTSDANSYAATFNVTSPFGITGIPALVSNQFVYSPAVNRLLQLAANIDDASTTNFYPSVFRPLFTVIQNGKFNGRPGNCSQALACKTPAFGANQGPT